MSKREATAILVAGMHRSGTSALTGALGAAGIDLGGRLLAPGNDNPKGYWEHEDAVGIHERLLASLDRHWDDVRALPENWRSSEAARVASAEISELIARDFAQSSVWAIKDPRICRFLPLWVAATERFGVRPVVLFVARQPSEVAASIKARNRWAMPIGELLWMRHILEAEAASRTLHRATVVYDDLLADPEVAISSVLDQLEVRHKEFSEDESLALKRFVDGADRHHRHTAAKQGLSGFEAIAQAAYEALVDTARGNDMWHSLQDCAVRFDKLWQTTGAPVEAAADMAHQLRLKEADAQMKILDLSSRLKAQIQWSEQAVVIRSELQADHDHLKADHDHLKCELDLLVGVRDRLAGELKVVHGRVNSERQDHEAHVRMLTARHDETLEALRNSRAEAASLDTMLAEMRISTSWRVTRPLRTLSNFLRETFRRTKG